MKTLTIRRKKWLRGNGEESTAVLRNTSGGMCCLGFYARSLNIPVQDILGELDFNSIIFASNPKYGTLKSKKYSWKDFNVSKTWHDRAALINDDYTITPNEREKKLKEHFKKINVKVQFTD